MSDYTKNTDFLAKDGLASGDPDKIIKGSDFDTEFNAIAVASNSKITKIAAPVLDNVVLQTATGDVKDSGYSFSSLSGAVVVTADEINAVAALTANNVVVAGATGLVESSAITATQLSQLSGVSSNVQTQINTKFPTAGGTLGGYLTLNADPTTALHAATKQYADSAAAAVAQPADIRPWHLVGETTINNGTTATLDVALSTYNEFRLVADNVTRLTSGGTLYLHCRSYGSDTGTAMTVLTVNYTSQMTSNFEIPIYKPGATVIGRRFKVDGVNGNTGAIFQTLLNPSHDGAITGVRLYTVGNGPFTGTFKLYGR